MSRPVELLRRFDFEIAVVAALTIATGWYRRSGGFVNDDWAFFFRDGTTVDGWLEPHAGHLVAGSIFLYKALHAAVGFDYPTFYVALQVVPFAISRVVLAVVLRLHGVGRGIVVATTIVASLIGAAGIHRLVLITNYISLVLILVLGWLLIEPSRRLRSKSGWFIASAALLLLATVNEQVVVPVVAFSIVAWARRAPLRVTALGVPAMVAAGTWLIAYGSGIDARSSRDLSGLRELIDVARDSVAIAVAYVAELTALPTPLAAVLLVVLAAGYGLLAQVRPLSGLEAMLLITLALGIAQRSLVLGTLDSGAEVLGARHFKQPLTELVVLAGLAASRISSLLSARAWHRAAAAAGVAALLAVNVPTYRDLVLFLENGAEEQRNTIEILHDLVGEPVVDPHLHVSRQISLDRVGRLESMGYAFTGPSLRGDDLEARTAELRGLLRFGVERVDGPGVPTGSLADARTGERFDAGCLEYDRAVLRMESTTGGEVFIHVGGPGARLSIRADDNWGPSSRNTVVVDGGAEDQWVGLRVAPVPGGISVRLRTTRTEQPPTVCF